MSAFYTITYMCVQTKYVLNISKITTYNDILTKTHLLMVLFWFLRLCQICRDIQLFFAVEELKFRKASALWCLIQCTLVFGNPSNLPASNYMLCRLNCLALINMVLYRRSWIFLLWKMWSCTEGLGYYWCHMEKRHVGPCFSRNYSTVVTNKHMNQVPVGFGLTTGISMRDIYMLLLAQSELILTWGGWAGGSTCKQQQSKEWCSVLHKWQPSSFSTINLPFGVTAIQLVQTRVQEGPATPLWKVRPRHILALKF